jgi:hypothetical protein
MNSSIVEMMKVTASKNLKFMDAKFKDFESIDIEEESESIADEGMEDYSSHVEIWANMSLTYEGELPDSYRVLNRMIGDWVDDHDDELKKEINPKLLPFLKDHFKDVDLSDLSEEFDDYIWEDQVDYMPDIREDKKEIDFTIELVLDVEESDEDDD